MRGVPEDSESHPRIGGEINTPHAERVIRAFAARQHGVVSKRQLLAAGLSPKMIERRCAAGRLIPVHRGVYAVGHASLRREGLWLAAVLAAGPGAALSHRDAATLHGLLHGNAPRIDVTTPGQRRVPGVRIHARRVLDAKDMITVQGIPTTTISRTLVDLAEVLPHQRLRKALEEADRAGALDVNDIEDALRRTRGRRGGGHATLVAALEAHDGRETRITRSELEDRFLALLDAHAIPRPQTNANIDGLEVDAYWPDAGLVVELDGYAFHRTRAAFQHDRERTNALTLAGYTVLRFTYGDVMLRAAETAARVTRARGSAPRPRRSARPAR